MKKNISAISVVFTIILFVSACGFRPLYAGDNAPGGRVLIGEIEGRSGHILRRELLRELSAGLPGRSESAELTLILDTNFRPIALQRDEGALRSDYRGRVDYVLALSDDALSGTVRAETSYSVPSSAFGELAAQRDSQERLMRLLAKRIADDIRLKLASEVDEDA